MLYYLYRLWQSNSFHQYNFKNIKDASP